MRDDASPHRGAATEEAFTCSARESGAPDEEEQGGQTAAATSAPPPPPPPQPPNAWRRNRISRDRASTHPGASSANDNAAVVDVLNELVGGRSYVRGRPRFPVTRFGSSSTGWSAASSDGQGMSVNPAREVENTLRFVDGLSDVDGASIRSGRSTTTGSEQEMDTEHRPERHSGEAGRDGMDTSLPANDGMKELRQQLQEIRHLAISTEEKARRMHSLMTQEYVSRQVGNISPMSLGGDAKSVNDEPAALDVGLAALPIDPSNPYNLRPGDLEPSFSPLPYAPPANEDMDESMEDEEPPIILGCMHYKRNVKVQCFDCHRWFPCRYCHDQSQDLPFPHALRRKMTRNMMCMLCQTPQPAAETCMNCGEYAAWYFCPKCKLWDNDSNKRIYHCDECGICRLGEGLGKDFVHCKKCDVCISIATSAAHTCVENATKGPCPLCLDEMFASRAKVVSLPCGHYMHAECYRDLMAVTYKCPVCSKSAVNMELQWRKLDDEIRAQPMPEDDEELDGLLPHLGEEGGDAEAPTDPNRSPSLQPRRPRKVWIGCNDCNNRCWTPFHWLGLKCQHCDSYNTNQMGPTAGHVESEAERLLRQQQVPQQQEQLTGNAVLRAAGIGTDGSPRIDSALDVPSSPSFLAVPTSPGSPSSPGSSSSAGMPSPRRYFVRDTDPDAPRRPSFTTARFSTPTLPTLPNLPEMPRLPRMPNLPNMPAFIDLPQMPNLPNMPHMPEFAGRFADNWPNLPNIPNLPNMPEFGKFSPYHMFDSLSRSLSPMRYYLQGLDVRDPSVEGGVGLNPRTRGRERRASRLSVRSDPTADATVGIVGGRPGMWSDSEDEGVDGDDEEDYGDDDVEARRGRGLEDDGEEEDGDGESESESEGSEEEDDAEMGDDEDDGGADDPMELFGHR